MSLQPLRSGPEFQWQSLSRGLVVEAEAGATEGWGQGKSDLSAQEAQRTLLWGPLQSLLPCGDRLLPAGSPICALTPDVQVDPLSLRAWTDQGV